MQGKIRNTNIELLRILSMMLIIAYHARNVNFPGGGYIVTIWTTVLGSWGILGVDIFVIISAFFLKNTKFDIRRIISTLVQFIMYVGMFYIICFVYDIYKYHNIWTVMYKFLELTIDALTQPLFCDFYWFLTAYIFFLLNIPILNKLVSVLNKKNQEYIIVISAVMSLFSYKVQNVIADVFFFSLIYLIVSYINDYEAEFFFEYVNSKYKIYFMIALIALMVFVCRISSNNLIIKFIQGICKCSFGNISRYSMILLFAALVIFSKTVKRKPFYNKLINHISALTLGIYFFHENALLDCPNILRSIFKFFINRNYFKGSFLLFPIKYIAIILLVFIMGGLVEFLRNRLLHPYAMKWLENRFADKFDSFNRKIDSLL